jgi:beta-phosphoglucomutase-like phosphatase (HAD superfamily)
MKAIDAVLFDPVGVVVDERGEAYEDAAPALAELEALGVRVIALPAVSEAELTRAVRESALSAERVVCLTHTEQGIRAARAAGVHPVLMMNDPDEAMRLTSLNPAGGIVSLHELPDLVRLIVTRSSAARSG